MIDKDTQFVLTFLSQHSSETERRMRIPMTGGAPLFANCLHVAPTAGVILKREREVMKPIAAMTLVALAAGFAFSQSVPSFEVASIRLNKDPRARTSLDFSPGGERFVAINAPLKLLILTAYGVTVPQFAWEKSSIPVLSERYDIEAKAGHPIRRDEMLGL